MSTNVDRRAAVVPRKKQPPAEQHRPTLKSEIERRQQDHRMTPAHRRIVQVLLDHESQVGFLSSMELAKLASVSQPSVTRFAASLGFDGFAEMRKCFRDVASSAPSQANESTNKYQAAALAESANVSALVDELSDVKNIREIGVALASSRPLVVLGLRASASLAAHFSYFAAKVHPDVREIVQGGSMIGDVIEQARVAGAKVLLVFAMPLYPRETIEALQHAKQLGYHIVAVADPGFNDPTVSSKLSARFHSSLVFDCSAAAWVLVGALLDVMCDAMPGYAENRLEHNEKSSTKRRVFIR